LVPGNGQPARDRRASRSRSDYNTFHFVDSHNLTFAGQLLKSLSTKETIWLCDLIASGSFLCKETP
jgi:hypothetical protein